MSPSLDDLYRQLKDAAAERDASLVKQQEMAAALEAARVADADATEDVPVRQAALVERRRAFIDALNAAYGDEIPTPTPTPTPTPGPTGPTGPAGSTRGPVGVPTPGARRPLNRDELLAQRRQTV